MFLDIVKLTSMEGKVVLQKCAAKNFLSLDVKNNFTPLHSMATSHSLVLLIHKSFLKTLCLFLLQAIDSLCSKSISYHIGVRTCT